MKTRAFVLGLVLLSFAMAPDSTCAATPGPTGSGGSSSVGVGGSGEGGAGGSGGGVMCEPFSKQPCYTGPKQTKNVGDCAAGFLVCNALGTGYGFCEGEITPQAESCDRPGDENCDGVKNEGCP